MKYVVAMMVGLMSVAALADGSAKCQVYKWKEGKALDLSPESLVYAGVVDKGSYIIAQKGYPVRVSANLGTATMANAQIYSVNKSTGLMILSDLGKEISSLSEVEAMLVDHKSGLAVSCK